MTEAALRVRIGRLAAGLTEIASGQDQARHDLGRPGALPLCTLAQHHLGVAAMLDTAAETLTRLAAGEAA